MQYSRGRLAPQFLCAVSLAALTLGACDGAGTSGAAPAGQSEKQAENPAVEIAIAAAEGPPPADAPHAIHPGAAMTGRPLTEIQAAYDIRRYELSIRVMPETKSLEGVVTVAFRAVAPLEQIELDLDTELEVTGATLEGEALEVIRDEDKVFITLPQPLEEGGEATVSVAYGGKPHIATAPPWHGGFVWSETDGTPWFATAVQTEGCDLWWPCKDHYADKPEDGVEVAISAPDGVKVASVGMLAAEEKGDDGFTTWRWRSEHPYTGYAIAINGGPYTLIEDSYKGVNGETYPIQFWALAKNVDKAKKLIETDVKPDLAFFERLLGPYPWGPEKVGFVETPHLGMEHQTINAYGEQYKAGEHGFDQLLHHELAHEWFGNLLTHKAPKDSWLHEGYGSYMQAVYSAETVGDMAYKSRMLSAYKASEHCRPVANAEALDIGDAFDNRDIYTKGAWVLHTVRNFIGEKAFWDGTRELLYGTPEPWSLPYPIAPRYRSTEDFIEIMSRHAGKDIGWMVEAYLYEAKMPELTAVRENGVLRLEWSAPGGRPFPMPAPISVNGERVTVEMPNGAGSIEIPENAHIVIDPDNTMLRQMPIIGDCSEQTDAEIAYNKDRYSRMAREYGWQRD